MACMFGFGRCINIIFNSLLAQLIRYNVHTTRKIKFIHAIIYHILLFYWPNAAFVHCWLQTFSMSLCCWQEAWVHYAELLSQHTSFANDRHLVWNQLFKSLMDHRHSETAHNASWWLRQNCSSHRRHVVIELFSNVHFARMTYCQWQRYTRACQVIHCPAYCFALLR